MNPKPIIASLTVVAFLAVAVLGFMTLGHSSGHGSCIARTLQGASCPPDPFSYAAFHIGALKGFSTAILNSFTASLIIFSVLMAFLGLAVIFKFNPRAAAVSNLKAKRPINRSASSYQSRIFSWIAFFLNSPNPF